MATISRHAAIPATIATLCAAGILSIFAFAQFGTGGLAAIAAFAVASIASVWISMLGAAALASRHPALSALFASSGIRMVAPLMVVLAIVLSRGRWVPIEIAYYMLPIYLCMLAADVAVWVREKRKSSEAD